MSIINDKPEIAGIEVNDFYALMLIEFFLLLICFFGIASYNFLLGIGVFVFTGGLVFVFVNLKKLLPEHFFYNLFKFLTEPKIYITNADLNNNHPLLKKILEDEEKNG